MKWVIENFDKGNEYENLAVEAKRQGHKVVLLNAHDDYDKVLQEDGWEFSRFR